MNEHAFEYERRKALKLFNKLRAWGKDLSINPFRAGSVAYYEWWRLYGEHGLAQISDEVVAA
jgi:hypothetical protein